MFRTTFRMLYVKAWRSADVILRDISRLTFRLIRTFSAKAWHSSSLELCVRTLPDRIAGKPWDGRSCYAQHESKCDLTECTLSNPLIIMCMRWISSFMHEFWLR